jgi:hypothetical protein
MSLASWRFLIRKTVQVIQSAHLDTDVEIRKWEAINSFQFLDGIHLNFLKQFHGAEFFLRT